MSDYEREASPPSREFLGLIDDEDLKDLSDRSANAHIEHGSMIAAVGSLGGYSPFESPSGLDAATIERYRGIARTVAGKLATNPTEIYQVIARYDELILGISEET
jgi:hypothetical protein